MLGGTRAAIVEADAMIAAIKAGLYPSFFIGRPSARLMTATSAGVEPPHFPKKKTKNPTNPGKPPPQKTTPHQQKITNHKTNTTPPPQSPHTRRKKGMASKASASIPSNIFWMIAMCETCVNEAPTSTPAINANGTGTPRYPKNRNKKLINPRTRSEFIRAAPRDQLH